VPKYFHLILVIFKIDNLEQCFSTFFGSRHPVGLKKIGGTLTWLK
jgi:hypothetical protein